MQDPKLSDVQIHEDADEGGSCTYIFHVDPNRMKVTVFRLEFSISSLLVSLFSVDHGF